MFLCMWEWDKERHLQSCQGRVKCPRISTVTSSPFSVSPINSSAPPTMPHPLGNRIMNTITAAASKSCLSGWFSSWFSRKMSWESLQNWSVKSSKVSLNVGTWAWDPMALRRVGSPESVALTEVPKALWRSTETLISEQCIRQDWVSMSTGD